MKPSYKAYYSDSDCDLFAIEKLCSQQLDAADVSLASAVEKNVPIYDAGQLGPYSADPIKRKQLMAQWSWVIGQGPGVFVIKNAQPDHQAIDQATQVFKSIIAAEKQGNGGGADHFAAAGANDRIWNALQKLCLKAPEVFARYHASPAIHTAAQAWLGPGYQMTAQVNLVYPGGQPQTAHRDYHLGFQAVEVAAEYPAHVHLFSPQLTLQGGLAHVDMGIEAGPTKLLPFSQAYAPGYLAYHRADFKDFFEQHFVQLPLNKGDALFFSPAIFHAAGENRTSDVHRLVNLFQVSSAYGRAMEAVDRLAMSLSLFQPLVHLAGQGVLDDLGVEAAIASCAEGYSFPTNLDTDPPVGGLAPRTQAAVLTQAVAEGWSQDQLARALTAQRGKMQA